MLKALELSGFKSFADQTRLEFPRGISVIVGPNGSGKSNLVDGVKWVLGSQSAKSLRGKEMTDVIFNGCASRGPLGTAEVTLTLENDDGRLPLDAKEVHVTRRVYRSGEGEYLLNRQPCRLRDIRDLLAGTGITTEAYCIIEQGKVDALLQSSPRDRRVIFEEAAGISQFKSKKATAERRLERVEQNLLRLSDIVDEVESRLRSVRSQAGKARRYRENAARLEQLRTELGLVDWREQTREIDARETQLTEVRRRADEQNAVLERSESALEELERRLESGNQRAREIEAAAAEAREQMAGCQATLVNQQVRHAELQQEIERTRRRLATMATATGHVDEQFRGAAAELESAERELAAVASEREHQLEAARQTEHERDEAQRKFDEAIHAVEEHLRTIAQADVQLAALHSQLTALRASQNDNANQLGELAQERQSQAAEAQRCAQTEAEVRSRVEEHHKALRAAESQLAQVREELARADKQHRQLEARIARCRERIAVLTELEQRLEGLDGSIQEVLRRAQEEPNGPLGEVCGVVADLLHVDIDTAHLIEAALGERAQFVVVESASRLMDWLQHEPFRAAGRIGFLRLDARPPASVLDHVDLSAESGVMGRADRFIETAPQYAPLVKRLLSRTWLVDGLATALRLSQSTGRGLEFVTSDGEVLAADGTLIIGPRLGAAGIMSRRSELRACHEQLAELENQLAHSSAAHDRLQQQRAEQETLVAASIASYTGSATELAECRHATAAANARFDQVALKYEQLERDGQSAIERLTALGRELEALTHQRESRRQALAQLQAEAEASQARAAAATERCARLQQRAIERQVAAAKIEQRVEMLHQQVELAHRNRHERDQALAETRDRHRAHLVRLVELEASMLAARQTLAQLYLNKEQLALVQAQQLADDEQSRAERVQLAARVRQLRRQLDAITAQQHKLAAAVSRLKHERQTLCERMQDDYGIDLAACASGMSVRPEASATTPGKPGLLDRPAVEREITQLRDQINNIGAVNLEALDELDSLEARFGTLSGQYHDLVDAKASLERIIQRINTDSRQLFRMTLETVRGHFQELFRRLFGGGEADIVLDEADDELESGIEIVARPPGKEACSISLLSGGEKTLTCVALLLAVFRSKPSPFCILDEVDAALDEANIGRFIGVLREFLSFTQFVVVTHSKKTMAGADTLYGVTMEESGVSKRVSVRFEDVSEDGHILPSALIGQRRGEGGIDSNLDAIRRAA